MAQIVGYKQDPQTSAYTFHNDDGTSQMFMDTPRARELAGWVDQTRPPDQRLASNDPHAAPAPAPMAPPAAPEQRADVQPQMQQQPEPSQAQAITAAINAPVYVPGRAAVDPQKMKREGVAVPVARTTTGLNLSPEDRQQFEESRNMAREQSDMASAEMVANQAKSASLYEQQATYYAQQAEAAQKERERIAAEDARRQAERQRVEAPLFRDQEAIAKEKVDPTRIFNGDSGAIRAIGSAIAVGLGAFGAALTGGQNYALQIIQASIDRDIEAQKENIQNRQEANQTALARIQQQYGVPHEEATKILRSHELRYAEMTAQKFAAQAGTVQAQQKALELVQGLSQARMKNDAEFYEMVNGRSATQEQFVQPQKATAGYYRDPTDKERTGRIGLVKGVQEVTGTAPAKPGETGIVRIGDEQFKAPKDVAEKAQDRLAAIDAAERGLLKKQEKVKSNFAPGWGDSGDELKVIDAENEAAMARIHGVRSTDPKVKDLAASGTEDYEIGEGGTQARIDQALADVRRQRADVLDRLKRGAGMPETADADKANEVERD
jgi:hypothetical protein